MKSITEIKADLERENEERLSRISLAEKREIMDLLFGGMTIEKICGKVNLDLDVVCGVITKAGSDRAAYRIVGCSWCGKAFDSVTREYVEKPERILSHGICDKCSAGILAGSW